MKGLRFEGEGRWGSRWVVFLVPSLPLDPRPCPPIQPLSARLPHRWHGEDWRLGAGHHAAQPHSAAVRARCVAAAAAGPRAARPGAPPCRGSTGLQPQCLLACFDPLSSARCLPVAADFTHATVPHLPPDRHSRVHGTRAVRGGIRRPGGRIFLRHVSSLLGGMAGPWVGCCSAFTSRTQKLCWGDWNSKERQGWGGQLWSGYPLLEGCLGLQPCKGGLFWVAA